MLPHFYPWMGLSPGLDRPYSEGATSHALQVLLLEVNTVACFPRNEQDSLKKYLPITSVKMTTLSSGSFKGYALWEVAGSSQCRMAGASIQWLEECAQNIEGGSSQVGFSETNNDHHFLRASLLNLWIFLQFNLNSWCQFFLNLNYNNLNFCRLYTDHQWMLLIDNMPWRTAVRNYKDCSSFILLVEIKLTLFRSFRWY